MEPMPPQAPGPQGAPAPAPAEGGGGLEGMLKQAQTKMIMLIEFFESKNAKDQVEQLGEILSAFEQFAGSVLGGGQAPGPQGPAPMETGGKPAQQAM